MPGYGRRATAKYSPEEDSWVIEGNLVVEGDVTANGFELQWYDDEPAAGDTSPNFRLVRAEGKRWIYAYDSTTQLWYRTELTVRS